MALDQFTTVALTRAEAGFANNANVTDPVIQVFVDAANGEVASNLSNRYYLPLSNNTNYASSLTESYLKQLTTNLAAGLLLLRQYEGMGGDMDDLALAKIQSSRSQLREIQKGERILVGSDGSPLLAVSAGSNSISGHPNNTTERTNRVGINDVF